MYTLIMELKDNEIMLTEESILSINVYLFNVIIKNYFIDLTIFLTGK